MPLPRFLPLLPVAAAAAATVSPPAAAQEVVATHGAPLLGIDDAELTPDGRYVVARDNTFATTALVYDAATGAKVFEHVPPQDMIGGVCQDAVAVTDERAVVIGTRVMILDLTGPVPSLLAEHLSGNRARDVVVTPDGTLACVRCGEFGGGAGQRIFDLATGTEVASHPGDPHPWDPIDFEVDSVVADDEHAVFTSSVAGRTRVTVWDLHPAAGGAPAVVFETDAVTDQAGSPHDVAMLPSGRFAAVRSEEGVGLYRLDGASSGQEWVQAPTAGFEDFGGSAMDSLEVTDQRIVTISRRRGAAGTGALLDVFGVHGVERRFALLDGDPHDLAITPNGERLVTRTHTELTLFDIRTLPPAGFLTPLDQVTFNGGHTSWSAGLDSVAANDTRVVAASRKSGLETRIRAFDVSGDTLESVFGDTLSEPVVDVAITPDGTRAVVSGWSSAHVLDLRATAWTLQFDSAPNGTFPWCDGVAANDDTAVFFGADFVNGEGWLTVVDLFSEPASYCVSNPNSTGEAATIFVTGTASVGANDLSLWARDAPPNEFGQFFYGDLTAQNPFGDGFVCIAGQVARFSIQSTSSQGLAAFAVDNTNLPAGGGAIVVGSTWNFQFVYRDGGSATGFNLTDAVGVTFVN